MNNKNIENENKDTNYYDQVIKENKLNKIDNKNDIDKDEDEEEEGDKGGRKRKHAVCCITY